jgi:hypothetical protein
MNIDAAVVPAPARATILTPHEAAADRQARALQQARHCVILAVVTSPLIAADLIDRAVDLTREGVEAGACAQAAVTSAPPVSRSAPPPRDRG